MTPTQVVIPIRGRLGGKTRLSPVLDEEQRARVIFGMAVHVLEQVGRRLPGSDISVVSRDAWLLRELARRFPAIHPLVQPMSSVGLIDAIELGRQKAVNVLASSLMVLSADLPLVDAADLAMLEDSASEVAIATDRACVGTNALALRGQSVVARFPFLFGVESAAAHAEASQQLGYRAEMLEIPGIQHDLDTPEDWSMLDASVRESLLASGEPGLSGTFRHQPVATLLEHV